MLNFLSLNTDSFGINVNDTSIKIARLIKKRGYFDLSYCDEFAIDRGVMQNGEIKNEELFSKELQNALNQAKNSRLKTKYVIASLPEEKIFLQIIKLPKMDYKELKSAVNFEAQNYIPISVEDVYLDFQVIGSVSGKSDYLEVLIGAVPKGIADSYVSCFNKCGLVCCALEPESESISRALLRRQDNNSLIFLIDISQDNTTFIAFSKSSVQFVSSIPVSSTSLFLENKDNIEKGIREDIVSSPSAPKKDLKFLFNQIEKHIDYCRDHLQSEYSPSGSNNERVIISGYGAKNQEILDFFSKGINIPVEIGNPLLNIPIMGLSDDFKNKSINFSAVLGLALRGVGVSNKK